MKHSSECFLQALGHLLENTKINSIKLKSSYNSILIANSQKQICRIATKLIAVKNILYMAGYISKYIKSTQYKKLVPNALRFTY